MNRKASKTVKKAAMSLTALILMVSPIVGAETNTLDMSYDTYIQEVKDENKDIDRAEEEVMIAKYTLDKVDDRKGMGSSSLDRKLSRGYNIDEAQMNLDYAKWTSKITERQVELDASVDYYRYFVLKDQRRLIKDRIDLLEDKLDKTKIKVSLGTAVQSDVLDSELAIKKAELELLGVEHDMDQLVLKLNRYMDVDLTTALSLDMMSIPTPDYKVTDIDELMNQVIKYNGDIRKAKDTNSLKVTYIKALEDSGSDEDSSEVITAKKEASNAHFNINDQTIAVEYDILSSYNNLLNAKDQLSIHTLQLENLNQQLSNAKKRYDLGLLTEDGVEEAKLAVAEEELSYDQAKLDYYKQVESFKILTFYDENLYEEDED